MNVNSIRSHLLCASALVLALSGIVNWAEQPVVKPFLAETKVPYRVLLGDEATSKRYGIDNLPDTFLIDRQGRVAAAYRAGLVDRGNIEANIKALLSEH